jgi:molybdate transport system regulatory protein
MLKTAARNTARVPASRAAGTGHPVPKFKVWVAFASGAKLGHGRAELLKLIDRLGSIQRAVREMGMSYRNAWGYLRELERAAGFKLLERPAGRGPGGGTRLTADGRRFLERYQRFEAEIAEVANRRFRAIFSTRRKEPEP